MLQETTDSTVTYYTIGDDVLAQTTAGVTDYLLYDGHGSTRQLVNNTGAVVTGQQYNYDAYGVMLSCGSGATAAASANTSLLYSGEQYDSNLDQYYLRARYYNQNNGTFNRVDPYSGNTQDPQSLHKYAYVHNNPVNGIDPTGMFFGGLGGFTISVAIGAMLQGIYIGSYTTAMAPYAERIYGHASELNFHTQQKERDNATIIVHGISPHPHGWSSDFIDELGSRANNQDYYEFTWSGFTFTGTVGFSMPVHNVALGSLIRCAGIVQEKGYKNVNIVSHSWGTVLSRDALNAGVGNINTWVTMGSPLSDDTAKPSNLGYWLNIWCSGDPVVYAGIGIKYTGIENPGSGFLFNGNGPNEQLQLNNAAYPGSIANHGVYFTDPVSLDRIGARLDAQ